MKFSTYYRVFLIILFCTSTIHLFASESRSYEIMLPLTLIQSGQSVQSDVSDIGISGKLISTRGMVVKYSSDIVGQNQSFACIIPKLGGQDISGQLALGTNNAQTLMDGNELSLTDKNQRRFIPWLRSFPGIIDGLKWNGRMLPWTQSNKKSFGCSYRGDSSLGSLIDTVSYTFIISPENPIFTLYESGKEKSWTIRDTIGTISFSFGMFPDYGYPEWNISDVIITSTGNTITSGLDQYRAKKQKQEEFSLPKGIKKVQFIFKKTE